MNGRILFVIVAVVLAAIDLASKAWAYDVLGQGRVIEVIPGLFNLKFVYNEGAAFGAFGGLSESVRLPLFYGVSALAVGVLCYFSFSGEKNDYLYHIALGLIMSGVLGNLYDRVSISKVRDFLDFYVGTSHWPTFNIADAAIVVGAIYVVIKFWREKPEEAERPATKKQRSTT